MTARPSGAVCSPPSPRPSAIGIMPAIIAKLVIRIGRSRSRGALDAGLVPRRCPPRRLRSANVTSRIAFATATPTAMIAPMNDWMLSVVPREPEREHDARDHGGHRRDDDQREPQRLEVRRQQQEDHDDREQRGPLRRPSSSLLQRHDLPAHGDGDPRGQASPSSASAVAHVGVAPAEVLADDVRRERDHPLHVVAVVLPDRRARRHAGDVAQQDRPSRRAPATGTFRSSSTEFICGLRNCTWTW